MDTFTSLYFQVQIPHNNEIMPQIIGFDFKDLKKFLFLNFKVYMQIYKIPCINEEQCNDMIHVYTTISSNSYHFFTVKTFKIFSSSF
jgi:hypothetical protein